jgi:large subunit ribosomal protein L15
MFINFPLINSEKKARKRVGRGIGSTFGKTCGRGMKGQKARTGYSRKLHFEGGQTPLFRTIPKSGFTSRGHLMAELKTTDLRLPENSILTLQLLKDKKLIPQHSKKVKILYSGSLPTILKIVDSEKNIFFTKQASTLF